MAKNGTEKMEMTKNATEKAENHEDVPDTKKPLLPKDQRRKLFESYEHQDKVVKAAEMALVKAQEARSRVVLEIVAAMGNGPFDFKGQRLVASTRKKLDGTVVAFFRGPGKTEAIEV